jgi:hypothetical protein
VRALALILLLAFAGPSYYSQNIFDDEVPEKPESAEPEKSETSAEKTVAKPKKRKKKGRKKKKPAAKLADSGQTGYSPDEIARASYTWIPETEALQLISSAPGLKTPEDRGSNKPAETMAKAEPVEVRPPGQGFKLPQIPVTQVLIVAGFVILFLIYRFRVGRQIKRRKY